MTTLPPRKPPVTLNRLQQLLTEAEKQTGQPVRRLNMRVASMMLAGALSRLLDDAGEPTFLTKGGLGMELRMGDQARATQDVDIVLRGDPGTLIDNFEQALDEPYEGFVFIAGEPEPLPRRPDVQRVMVRVVFGGKVFTTLAVEVAPVEAGGDEFERVPAHDLSDIGLRGPESIPVLALHWQIAQKLHAVTGAPLQANGENVRFRDLIDLQLLEVLASSSLRRAREACVAVFAHRDEQSWPPEITIYPSWPEGYRAMAAELEMPITDVSDAVTAVAAFIDRIDNASPSPM